MAETPPPPEPAPDWKRARKSLKDPLATCRGKSQVLILDGPLDGNVFFRKERGKCSLSRVAGSRYRRFTDWKPFCIGLSCGTKAVACKSHDAGRHVKAVKVRSLLDSQVVLLRMSRRRLACTWLHMEETCFSRCCAEAWRKHRPLPLVCFLPGEEPDGKILGE